MYPPNIWESKLKEKKRKDKENVTHIFIPLCIHPELECGVQVGAEKRE